LIRGFGCRVSGFDLQVLGLGFGSRFRIGFSGWGSSISGFWIRISGSGFRVSGFGIQHSGFGVRDSRFGIRDSEFGIRVSGFGPRWILGACALALVNAVYLVSPGSIPLKS